MSVSIEYLLLNPVCALILITLRHPFVSLTTFHVFFFMVYLSIFVEWFLQ